MKAIQHLDLYENWCIQDGKQANHVTLCPLKCVVSFKHRFVGHRKSLEEVFLYFNTF